MRYRMLLLVVGTFATPQCGDTNGPPPDAAADTTGDAVDDAAADSSADVTSNCSPQVLSYYDDGSPSTYPVCDGGCPFELTMDNPGNYTFAVCTEACEAATDCPSTYVCDLERPPLSKNQFCYPSCADAACPDAMTCYTNHVCH